jgi:hypothetical protein
MPWARVIGVAVGNQCAVYGPPRVNVEIPCGAIDAAIGEGEYLGWHE